MEYTIADLVGAEFNERYLSFDLSKMKKVFARLEHDQLLNLAEAESLQLATLDVADKISDYLGVITKLISYYEAKINSAKNKAALEYVSPMGKTTADARKAYGESSPEVEALQEELARLRGAKSALEKKYDIAIKLHHSSKEAGTNMRKGILPIPTLPNEGEHESSKDWE